jgi:predicted nucleic acid-binding protein
VILPDVNTLLHAVNSSATEHTVALRALRVGFDDPAGVAFAWTALLAFLRLSTRRGIFPNPLSVDEALRVIENWLRHPHAQVVHPSEQHAGVVGRLLRSLALQEI